MDSNKSQSVAVVDEFARLRIRAESAEKELAELKTENERLREMLKPKTIKEPNGDDPEPFI